MKSTWALLGLSILLIAAAAGCGGAQKEVAADYCDEHQIAESRCPFCNEELIATMGMCPGHGVPEALCYQCSPELVAAFRAVGDWCGGHDRPESQCYICNPELDPDAQSPATNETAAATTIDERTLPQSLKRPTAGCTSDDLVVRLASAEIAHAAGFETIAVEQRTLQRRIACNAVVAYDGNRLARLASRVPGAVAEVHRDLGQKVERGDPLVTVRASQLGSAKADYHQAQASLRLRERNHQRAVELLGHGATSQRAVLEAENRVEESRIEESRARQELLSLGVDESRLAAIASGGDNDAGLELLAPFSGVVIGRDAVVGEVVDPSHTLISLADVSRMWVELDLEESAAGALVVGQPVELRADGLRGLVFTGTVIWVGYEVDPRTRLLRARAEVDNPEGLLKANMFARAEILVGSDQPVLVVPVETVQWDGCCNLVFERQSDTVFVPRKVHLGPAVDGVHEVYAGISGGVQIVTTGSYLLKTEILKGNLGAGCCETQPGS